MELASLRRQLKEVDVSRAAELEERMELEERARALPALRKELAAARQQLASATDQPDGCPLVLPSSSEQVHCHLASPPLVIPPHALRPASLPLHSFVTRAAYSHI
jgi:hypothetical protein